jgi:hypothetical protein
MGYGLKVKKEITDFFLPITPYPLSITDLFFNLAHRTIAGVDQR